MAISDEKLPIRVQPHSPPTILTPSQTIPTAMESVFGNLTHVSAKLENFIDGAEDKFDEETTRLHSVQSKMENLLDTSLEEISLTYHEPSMRRHVHVTTLIDLPRSALLPLW